MGPTSQESRRRGRPLRDPSLASLSPAERRARYREEERAHLLATFQRLRTPTGVAAELGIDEAELDRRVGRLSLRREVARLERESAPAATHGSRSAAAAATRPLLIRKREERQPAPPTRVPLSVAATPRPSEPEPKRFGRFVAGPAARRELSDLEGAEGKNTLWELIDSSKGNRKLVEQRLAQLYAKPDGSPVSPADLDALLSRQALGDQFRVRQAENVRFLFGFHKGARAKVAQALLVNISELDAMLADLGLSSEIEALRERQRAQVRQRMPLAERLRLVLSREKYLSDLGILEDVDRSVEAYVRECFIRSAAAAPAASAIEERVRRELGLDPEAMRRLIRRYRLYGFARSLLQPPQTVPPPTDSARLEIR